MSSTVPFVHWDIQQDTLNEGHKAINSLQRSSSPKLNITSILVTVVDIWCKSNQICLFSMLLVHFFWYQP